MFPKLLFILCLLFALTPWASPPLALALGLVLGFSLGNPFHAETRRATKYLLQASVVLLGFGMSLQEVIKAGRSGLAYTAIGIVFAVGLGLLLGRMFGVRHNTAYLIASGTAICGGSAIAAVGPVLGAADDEMSVSLAAVFVLNSIALLIFPAIGAALHLTQNQFGLWSALAIHDTSSVVGSAAKYGAIALIIATTVKLARALWIVPLCFFTAAVKRTKAKINWPWFILFFLLAAVLNSALHQATVFHGLYALGKIGLTATLFLIGAGMSRQTLRTVGAAPLLQAVTLWIIVAITSLLLIRLGVWAI
jgi:uncharacterized integral membrane protein (TIGR00698 family)